jgi:hypothetical protein
MNNPSPTWRKASYSSGNGCVEVGSGRGVISVRDTKQDGTGPVLSVSTLAWRRFTERLKDR